MAEKPFATCAICGDMGNSCCTFREGQACDTPTLVSNDEIKRILDVFPLIDKKKAFCEKPNTVSFLSDMKDLFPDHEQQLINAYTLNKKHSELAASDTGCRFYTTTGCALPRPVRPLFCKIYPFWFIHDKPMIFLDKKCLVLQNCSTADDIYHALGTNPSRIRQLFDQLCKEWQITPHLQTASTRATGDTCNGIAPTA